VIAWPRSRTGPIKSSDDLLVILRSNSRSLIEVSPYPDQWYLKVGDVLRFSFMVLGLRYRSHKLPNHIGSDALVTLGRLCDLFLGVTGQPHVEDPTIARRRVLMIPAGFPLPNKSHAYR
jgi:hypothetical protein